MADLFGHDGPQMLRELDIPQPWRSHVHASIELIQVRRLHRRFGETCGDVLFDDGLLTLDALPSVIAPVHVVEGSQTSAVDHAICDVVRRHIPDARHTLIEGAGHMMPLTHPEPLTRALLTGIEHSSRSIGTESAP